MTIPRLVGMVHLLALPGSPGFAGSMDRVIDTALADAAALADAGLPAIIVENLGDMPYHPERVEPVTVAAMARVVDRLRSATGLTIGVNVLRNDAFAALGIAAVTAASFIRVNVLTGTMFTDQGAITGPAADLMRQRAVLAPLVEVWADVMVKHASPPPGIDLASSARDTVIRGLADAVIVSGGGTGSPPRAEEVDTVRSAVPKGTRVVIGSGVARDNLASLTGSSDTVIVGSSLKVDGDPARPVDPLRAAALAEAARELGLI